MWSSRVKIGAKAVKLTDEAGNKKTKKLSVTLRR